MGALHRDTGWVGELLGYGGFPVRVFEGEAHLHLTPPFFSPCRVRRAPLVLLAAMGCRVLWGFLVLLDPRAWQERMEIR